MNALVDLPSTAAGRLKQHLIDPEICIRCNTCEATCPVHAITHDERNYVVDAATCNACQACVSPCPTGAIDQWRWVAAARPYSLDEQLGWDELPSVEVEPPWPAEGADEHEGPGRGGGGSVPAAGGAAQVRGDAGGPSLGPVPSLNPGSTVPPWSAAHPYTQLYGVKAPLMATVVGNVRVNDAGTDNETHHIVLDLGAHPFPVLEGQSIGVIPPGLDALGRPHHARQYSVASPRNGERPGYNNLALTVKRVSVDHQGRPVRGVASHFLCDAQVGDMVPVIGPFGHSFLMPNHAGANLVMICTGTGSAPMRAMTEWRRRLRSAASAALSASDGPVMPKHRARAAGPAAPERPGKLMLFFGARTQAELPYFGPLMKLPKDFIDIHLAFSREPGRPRRYVQDAMRERSADLSAVLTDENTFVYVCGLKAMEEGVLLALSDGVRSAGHAWDAWLAEMKRAGRLHLETY